MAADQASSNSTSKVAEMDYPAHHKNYSGFIKMLKWGAIATAIITAFVLFVIAN
jgi:hypothetical protein